MKSRPIKFGIALVGLALLLLVSCGPATTEEPTAVPVETEEEQATSMPVETTGEADADTSGDGTEKESANEPESAEEPAPTL